MYTAEQTREVVKEGRTFTYFSIMRQGTNIFMGVMVRVTTEKEEGEPMVHWYAESELTDPDKEACNDVNECFIRTVKAWKRRGKGRI